MLYKFHPEAAQEFYQAIDYYEFVKKGLGLDFAKEIYLTIQRILLFPSGWEKFTKNTRRSLTNKYPFGVLYQQKENTIIIIGIMPLKRSPEIWKNRIS